MTDKNVFEIGCSKSALFAVLLLTAACSLPKQVYNQGQDDADEDASPQRGVNPKISPFIADIPGQMSQPRDLGSQQEHGPQDHQNHSSQYQKPA
jgi:hypothetical protein